MGHGHKESCVLCQRSDETKVTGPLSVKGEVTAHQNCLLFSSGIYCRDSPQFDDLFGFSVEDVQDEVKRGSKLICSLCKKKGATAGCEVKRCKKSYHYPCAVEAGAKTIEDADEGSYGLYCSRHSQQQNNGSVNGSVSSFKTSENPSEAAPSKNTQLSTQYENQIGKCIVTNMQASHERDTSAAEPSVSSSESSHSVSSTRQLHSKRRLSFSDRLEGTESKRKSGGRKWIISDDEDSANEPDADLAEFAPIEFDLEESANSASEPQLISKEAESPSGPTSGRQQERASSHGSKDEDETDAESESLLLPVGSDIAPQPLSTRSAALTSELRASAAQPTVILNQRIDVVRGGGEGSSPRQHTAGPSVPHQHPEPLIDSSSFWKRCNAAGCTQAIFADFISVMNNIASRIQSDQASQEDYDLALTVMKASGKLEEIVTKLQKELQRKQTELQQAAAAVNDIVSLLRR